MLKLVIAFLFFSPLIAYAEHDPGSSDNSPTGIITEIFNWLRDFFQGWVSSGDIEKYPNPLGTTNQELKDLTDKAINTGQRGADLFFAMEEMLVSLVLALSPIELAVTIVALIAFGVTFLIILRLTRRMTRHFLIVGLIIGLIIILLMVFNLDISI